MNILEIINITSPYPGNLMSSLWKLEEKTAQSGNTVYLFPEEAQDCCWIKEMHANGGKVFFCASKFTQRVKVVSKLISKYNIDIAYIHFWNIPDCLSVKLNKIIHRRLKYVIHFHGAYSESQSRIREAIKHWILNADMSIGCSTEVAKELRASGYRNVKGIDNCINFERLDNYKKTSMESHLNLLTFSSCGFYIKGLDISIKAVQECRNRGIDAWLYIAVSCQKENIKKNIAECCGGKIPEWVVLLPPRDDIATYYHSCDAYLNASRSEGFCYASAEAAYCGTQVIQSDIPQNRLDIPDTLIFKTEDVQDLAEKIEILWRQKQTDQTAAVKRRREYVAANYGIDSWVTREMEALQSLLY